LPPIPISRLNDFAQAQEVDPRTMLGLFRIVEQKPTREIALIGILSLTDRRSSAAIAPDFNADLVYEAIVRSLWS
jgi:hypothetical protein